MACRRAGPGNAEVVAVAHMHAAPVAPAAQRKRKKAASDGGAAAAAAGTSISPPPAAKKPRVAGPKAKGGKADKGQEDVGELVAREETRGRSGGGRERELWACIDSTAERLAVPCDVARSSRTWR